MLKTILSEQYIRIVRYLEILIVVLLIPLFYNFIPINKTASYTLFIDANSIESTVRSLEENGYTVTPIDKLIMQIKQTPETGWYTLNTHRYGRFSFFKNIYRHKAKTMKIVVFAGETHNELIDRIANDMKLDREKLYTQYKTLSRFKEADIFSGTYTVARKADEKRIMLYLFNKSQKILDLFIEKTFRNKPSHFELKVLLTLASIIQKESNTVNEMPLISSVIYNRLAKNMRLQMDSTLNYGKYSHVVVTPERIKSDTSYYNTYKHKGLPPYPLGTISIEALHAAMYPEKNKYIFFMLKPDGTHNFCNTYDEHLTNIRVFREHQKKKAEAKEREEAKMAKAKKCQTTKVDNNESNARLSSSH